MSQGGWEFRGNLDSYLSPEWPFGEEDVSSVSLSGDPAVIEMFSADMESYVLAYVRSTANLSAEDEQTISSVIAAHRDINVAYCRRLLSWIVSSRGTNSLQAIVDEYLQFAPGPWREATLVAYLPLSHKARGVTAGGGGTVAARDGSGATEVDDASDEILSISGSTVMTDLSPLTAGSATKAKIKKLVALCNKYKAECAMLKDRLLEMRANDIEMLQDKLRGAQLDLQTVKRRNVDLKGRVQLLESQLHDALAEAGAGAGAGVGAGDSRRRAAGGTTGRERGGAIVYSDASSTVTARAEPSTDATAAVAVTGVEIAALRKQVRLLETRLQAVGSSSRSSSTGGQAAAGEVSATKAAAGLPKADKRVRIAETAPAVIASSGTNASAIAAAAAAAAVAASPPLPPPPPSFASTLHTLAVPLPLHAALASALDAWVDHEVAVAKSVDLGVIRGLLAELREMKPDGQGQEDGQEQEEGRLGEDGDGAAATNSNSAYRTGSTAATGKIKGVGGGGAIAKNKLSGPSASAPTRPTTQKTQQRSGAPVPPWPELRAFSLGVFIVILSQSLLLTGRKLIVADLSAGAANVYAWIVWMLDAGWPVCCQWAQAAVGAGRGLWEWLSELASLLIAVSAVAKG